MGFLNCLNEMSDENVWMEHGENCLGLGLLKVLSFFNTNRLFTKNVRNSFAHNKTLARRQRLNPDFTRSSNHFYIKISPPPTDQIYIKLVFNIKFYIKMPDFSEMT